MKKLLPRRTELAIFGALAIVCGGVVSSVPVQDVGLSLLSIPIFIGSAMMGMRRSGQLDYIRQKTVAQDADTGESVG